MLWLTTRRMLSNRIFPHISDYGPIDENASDTNDQFRVESKRKAKYKNNDEKVCRLNKSLF